MACAHVLPHIGRSHRRIRILGRLDGVNAVAIGAHRRLPVAARDRLPVDALHVLLPTLSWHLAQVAGTLNLLIGDLGSLAPRMSCSPWQSVQTAAFSEPRGHRLAMYALLVGGEGRGADAAGGHHEFLAVTCAAGLRNVGARYFRLGIAGRQNLVDAAVAVLALGDVGVSRRGGLGMDAMIVSRLLDRLWQVAHTGLAGVGSCGKALMSVWQSVQPKTLWMEALNFASSTCRLTGLPFSSLVRVASLWQARHSSLLILGAWTWPPPRCQAARQQRKPDRNASRHPSLSLDAAPTPVLITIADDGAEGQ